MNEFFAAVLMVALFSYFGLSGLFVAAYSISESNAASDCAIEHNVYECEKITTWRPVVK